jgi:hypothetical protein
MSLMKLGVLFEIIGFVLATIFAAILLERKFIGEFATKFEHFFSSSAKEFNEMVPYPPKSSVYKMIGYFVQTLFIIGSCYLWYYLDNGFHSIFSILTVISLIILWIVPSYIRYKLWKKTYKEKLTSNDRIDWFLTYIFNDALIIILSIPGLLFVSIMLLLRITINWLAQSDKVKKVLIVIGTIIAITGLILEFIAS